MRLTNYLIEIDKGIISSFIPKKTLNPKIWNKDMSLRDNVKEKIKDIAELFYKSLKIKTPIIDIYLTGSNTNYNWSEYSDLDIHLIIDKSKISDNKDLVDEYLQDKKNLFSQKHDIKIFDYDVELYAQDVKEDLAFDAGIYSINKDKWINKPKQGKFNLNTKEVIHKSEELENKINGMLKDKSEKALRNIDSIKEKLRKMRGTAIKNGGEFSVENLAYKYLRRKGLLDKLNEHKQSLEDKRLSL